MDPDKIMSGLSKEICATLKTMEKAKTADEKLTHSKTVKNLCESLGVFLKLMAEMAPHDDDGEPIPF